MSMTLSSSQYFEKVAGQWDSLRTGYFTEAVREMAFARAYLCPGEVVLDIGSGDEMDGVSAYSVIVSARKGSGVASLSQKGSCTCR